MPEIRDKIDELRGIFCQRYGVDVRIEIKAYKSRNPHMTRELANYISHELASMMGPEKIGLYYNSQNDLGNHRWVTLVSKDGFEFAGHY